MTEVNIVKNQHYIPEALLRHFINSDGKFFEILLSTKTIYPTNPGSSMCEKFVYEDDALKINTVENYFAKIDGEIAPLVEGLISLINKHENDEIKFSEIKKSIENILPIFAVFYYRSGALLTEFSSINQKDKIPLLSKKILNFDYINRLAATIKNCYKFAIIESDDDFLLSDQFISTAALKIKSRFFDRSNRHIGLKETMILIPISSRYYGVYWNTDNNFIINQNALNVLSKENIKLINRALINNSYVKCVGQKQERIEEVLGDFKWASPINIFAGGNPPGYVAGATVKKEVFFYEEEEKAYDLLDSMSFMQYKNLGRNDPCVCRSGRKFKKCHEGAYNRIQLVIQSFGMSGHEVRNAFGIPGAEAFELPIDQWSGFQKDSK